MTILILGGNAYRLASDDTLETAAVLIDGTIENDWGQVDFDLIPDDEKRTCLAIADALERLSFAEAIEAHGDSGPNYVPDGPFGEVSNGDFVIATVEGKFTCVGTIVQVFEGINRIAKVRTDDGETQTINCHWLRRAAYG